jgi:hypothetical protein
VSSPRRGARGGPGHEVPYTRLCHNGRVDRRLASKNIRTGLIAGGVSLFMFAASFFAALIY